MSFQRQRYSGICLCGHPFEKHHLSSVANPDAYAVMGPRFASECEAYGSNEFGGTAHCQHYVDAEDPDEALRASWTGTKAEEPELTEEGARKLHEILTRPPRRIPKLAELFALGQRVRRFLRK